MFIDRVIKAERYKAFGQHIDRLEDVVQELRKSTVIIVDNVAQYYYVTCSQEEWDLAEDFPNIAPPWPNIWFEWSPTEWINSAEDGWYKNEFYGRVRRYGLFLKVTEIPESIHLTDSGLEQAIVDLAVSNAVKEMDYIDHDQLYQLAAEKRLQLRTAEKYGQVINMFRERMLRAHKLLKQEVRWTADVIGFLRIYQDIYILPLVLKLLITGEGRFRPMSTEPGCIFQGIPLLPGMDRALLDKVSEMISILLHVPLLSLCFANCKNVTLGQYRPSSNKKKDHRAGKHYPAIKYHVLEIDPVKRVLDSTGKVQEKGLRRALHICRGHFATYREDSRLFGKHVGTFWRPMHVRGEAGEGMIVKDYAVKASKETRHGLV